MTQPEALRLADAIDPFVRPYAPDHLTSKVAAAELRRLHAENERLHQINCSHEVKLSVRGYEIQIADLEAQRDALLAEHQHTLALQQRSYEREIQLEVEAEREAIIQMMPGGHSVDPQWVCDAIRARGNT